MPLSGVVGWGLWSVAGNDVAVAISRWQVIRYRRRQSLRMRTIPGSTFQGGTAPHTFRDVRDDLGVGVVFVNLDETPSSIGPNPGMSVPEGNGLVWG